LRTWPPRWTPRGLADCPETNTLDGRPIRARRVAGDDRDIARRRHVLLLAMLLCCTVPAPSAALAAACDGSGTFTCPYTGTPDVVQHFGPGAMRLPNDVAVDASGATWVADFGRNQVEKFDPSGNPVALTTRIGNADGSWGAGNQQLHTPSGVGVDAAGDVYVADTNNNRVMEYDP